MPKGASFASRTYEERAIMLRTYALGEADRIVVMLTAGHGVVRAVAKGVRRTSSKFGSRLEPFNVSDVQLVHGRSLDIVSQAVAWRAWAAQIAGDYDKYVAAAAIVEAAERISSDDDEPAAQFRLLAGALSSLARGLHRPSAIVDSYLLRAVSLAGWAPSFGACAMCGAPGPHRAFSVELGGAVCPQCRPPGAMAPDPATMEHLAALSTGDWERADGASPAVDRAAGGIVAAYVHFHLERPVRALAMIERQ